MVTIGKTTASSVKKELKKSEFYIPSTVQNVSRENVYKEECLSVTNEK